MKSNLPTIEEINRLELRIPKDSQRKKKGAPSTLGRG